MRQIGLCPSMSDHGGMIIPSFGRISLVEGSLPILDGDWHICPRKHHGLSWVHGTGFATDMGIRYGCRLDSCGCGAYINFSSPIVTTD